MGLTDPFFFIICVAVTLGVLIAIVVWWRRLAGASIVTVVARLASLAALNTLVVLCAGVAVNNSYQFYASWADLFGSWSATTTTMAGGPISEAFQATPLPSPIPSNLQQPDALVLPNLRRATYTITGRVSGVTSQVTVVLPASYDSRAGRLRRYPVIMALHGVPGTPSGLLNKSGLLTTLDRLVEQHQIADSLVVAPNFTVPAGFDNECTNVPGDAIETFLAVDVPAWIRAQYRVETARTSWAAFGVSTGGWCSAVMTMLHPDQFAAGLVLSGYFTPEFADGSPYPPGSPQEARYDLIRLAGTSAPPVALWVFASKQDGQSWASTSRMLKVARAPLAVSAQIASTGGHNWGAFQAQVPLALAWLGANDPGFQPGHH